MMIGAIEPRGKFGYRWDIIRRNTNGGFGRSEVWQVVKVDETRPFPTRTVVSEHYSRAAAEKARAKLQ